MKKLEILGTGCPKCNKLYSTTEEAARELNLEFEITKVTDIEAITGYGVMMTPALVVDGVVMCVGKVPSFEDLKSLIG